MIIPTSKNTHVINPTPKKRNHPTFESWLEIGNIPEWYHRNTLDNCIDLPKELIEDGKKWAKSWPLKSLYLYGVYGSGKTSYAFALIRYLFETINDHFYFWPRYYSAAKLDKYLLRCSKDLEGEEYEIEQISNYDLLFIDDIDKVSATERFRLQLFEILNNRMMKRKPTIITSNCIPKEIGNLLDGAVISRMQDTKCWEIAQFPDFDLRSIQTLNINPQN